LKRRKKEREKARLFASCGGREEVARKLSVEGRKVCFPPEKKENLRFRPAKRRGRDEVGDAIKERRNSNSKPGERIHRKIRFSFKGRKKVEGSAKFSSGSLLFRLRWGRPTLGVQFEKKGQRA